MMHDDRSRDPPTYHPGWGGLTRKLVLEENTLLPNCVVEQTGPLRAPGVLPGAPPSPRGVRKPWHGASVHGAGQADLRKIVFYAEVSIGKVSFGVCVSPRTRREELCVCGTDTVPWVPRLSRRYCRPRRRSYGGWAAARHVRGRGSCC